MPIKKMEIVNIKIEKVSSNPYQPRKIFEAGKLQELANSIKEYGLLQPIVVSRLGDNQYQLIAGERRLEAAKKIGLKQVSAIIRKSSKQENLELALIENIHRHNLNAIEKAYAFKKMLSEFGLSQKKVAQKMGQSREAVANTLRILDLPVKIQRAILNNRISEGHGRAILLLSDKEKQLLLYQKIVKEKLTVRQTEQLAQKIRERMPVGKLKKSQTVLTLKLTLKKIENRLSDALNTKVKITKKGRQGKISVEFLNQSELKRIVDKLTENPLA